MTSSPVDVTVIVPTRNEADNVEPLVLRLAAALEGVAAGVLFVDDSSDSTPDEVRRVAGFVRLPVEVIHRAAPEGGLSGAVILGMREAAAPLCVVMDGDLQHPPEIVPRLLERFREGGADIVIASRYVPDTDSSSAGLAGLSRNVVSRGTTLLTRTLFPRRLRGCTDPMTGFFLVDRERVDLDGLRPRGFKILLEMLARQPLRIAEIPFAFASRNSGDSKATLRQGAHFAAQLFALRLGRRRA